MTWTIQNDTGSAVERVTDKTIEDCREHCSQDRACMAIYWVSANWPGDQCSLSLTGDAPGVQRHTINRKCG